MLLLWYLILSINNVPVRYIPGGGALMWSLLTGKRVHEPLASVAYQVCLEVWLSLSEGDHLVFG